MTGKFLKNLNNGLVFPWTDILGARSDMIECDANGKPLEFDERKSLGDLLKKIDTMKKEIELLKSERTDRELNDENEVLKAEIQRLKIKIMNDETMAQVPVQASAVEAVTKAMEEATITATPAPEAPFVPEVEEPTPAPEKDSKVMVCEMDKDMTVEECQEIAKSGKWSLLSKPRLMRFAKEICQLEFATDLNTRQMKNEIKRVLDERKGK